ncbi:isocitrate lyase/PEP mutase family protein [Arthrobacter psychrochitiniphilus]|uniref:isocitrate lyase/PEP mutase family protein n=1 Tax=Arthrobacter psychrochitiniphilus TaxID=291045 RepID=UPI0017BF5A1C|nr:isocitrate lyase/phosphoenolpyruvate mutase family protein [Arthrobacter psychrochitiniphilus]NYG16161.1 2-methylisocitrate lyase-like PEP mutase family enzyme [Arthrobacter psychrochitiniphilus]
MGSALAFAQAGFPAVGTTSFGVCASAGMPDGGHASKAATLALVSGLGRIPVHVSADIENGYSDDPEEVARFVAKLSALGVAGVNLEDSTDGHLVNPALSAAKIAAVKRGSPNVFVNARVDNYWFAEEATVDAVGLRAQTYTDAGADGIFVPGVSAADDIRRIAAGIELPLNVLAHATLTVAELERLGVRRVNSDSLPYRVSVDAAVNVVGALRDVTPVPAATPYPDMQAMLEEFHNR